MSKIVVVGSLHYDIMLDAPHRPEKGETVMGTACRYKFGGKGGNQALAASRAGAETHFVGAVGADESGRFLLSALQAGGVDIACVQVADGIASGMSVAISDAEGDYGAVVVSGANQHIAPDALRSEPLWRNAAMLILQNEIAAETNLLAAAAAKARGIPVCINAAPARPLEPALEACIDLLVINAVEARDMCGVVVGDLASAMVAAETLARRFRQVVVTAGEHGVAFCQQGASALSQPAEKIRLISTHGAGDCFTGVLCRALAAQQSLADAVRMANMAAAKHVSAS
ncbi:PfkB family carbohydrate kinase [Enterobacter sp. BRE11]|nr:PfkB family carbohydrate kinase [Enterobacter sp. BRE11]